MGRQFSRFEIVYKYGNVSQFFLFVGMFLLIASSIFLSQEVLRYILPEWMYIVIWRRRRSEVSVIGFIGVLIVIPCYWLLQKLHGKKMVEMNKHGKTMNGETMVLVCFGLSIIYISTTLIVKYFEIL